jgi:hypothetical protein
MKVRALFAIQQPWKSASVVKNSVTANIIKSSILGTMRIKIWQLIKMLQILTTSAAIPVEMLLDIGDLNVSQLVITRQTNWQEESLVGLFKRKEISKRKVTK